MTDVVTQAAKDGTLDSLTMPILKVGWGGGGLGALLFCVASAALLHSVFVLVCVLACAHWCLQEFLASVSQKVSGKKSDLVGDLVRRSRLICDTTDTADMGGVATHSTVPPPSFPIVSAVSTHSQLVCPGGASASTLRQVSLLLPPPSSPIVNPPPALDGVVVGLPCTNSSTTTSQCAKDSPIHDGLDCIIQCVPKMERGGTREGQAKPAVAQGHTPLRRLNSLQLPPRPRKKTPKQKKIGEDAATVHTTFTQANLHARQPAL